MMTPPTVIDSVWPLTTQFRQPQDPDWSPTAPGPHHLELSVAGVAAGRDLL